MNNEIELLYNPSREICCGQIYSRTNVNGEILYYLVTQGSEGYYLISLHNGYSWTKCTDDINKIFGVVCGRDDFTLITDKIVLTPR